MAFGDEFTPTCVNKFAWFPTYIKGVRMVIWLHRYKQCHQKFSFILCDCYSIECEHTLRNTNYKVPVGKGLRYRL